MARDVRAGGAFVEIYTDNSRLVRGLRSARRRLDAFANRIANVGRQLLRVATLAAAPFAASVVIFAKVGDQLNKLSARTGLTVESLSELRFAAEQSGASFDELAGGLRGMAKNLFQLELGTQTAKDAFVRLKLTLKDLENLSPDERFRLIAKRMSEIEDPSKKAAVAMLIFGRAGEKLVPMLGNIEALTKEARRLGLTIDTDTAQAAADFTDTMNRLRSVLRVIAVNVGAAVIDSFKGMGFTIADVSKIVIDWVKENKELIGIVVKVVIAVAAAGAALLAIAFAIKALLFIGAAFVAVFAAIGFVIKALFTPIGLLIAAVVVLGTIFFTQTQAGLKAFRRMKDGIGVVVGRIKSFFSEITDSLGLVVDLVKAGELKAAFALLWAAIKVVWQKGVTFIMKTWAEWKDAFLRVGFAAFFGFQRFLTNSWATIRRGWIQTTTFISSAWASTVATLKKLWKGAQLAIGKGYLQIQGFFDEDFDVSGSIAALEDEYSSTFAKIERNLAQSLRKSSAEEEKQLREINANQKSRLAKLKTEEDEARKGRELGFKEALDNADAELAAAKEAFKLAKNQAQFALAEAKLRAAVRQKEIDSRKDDPDRMAGALTGRAAGAFQLATAQRTLGVGGPVEKMTKLLAGSLEVQKDILKATKANAGNAVFG